MFCQGQLLPISEYDALFNLIGTIYGGDGNTTFALPDLRGRVPAGIGSGPGLPTLGIGETQGLETATLTTLQMPAHLHAQPSPALIVRGNGVAIANGDTTPSFADFTEFPPTDTAAGATTRSFTISNGGLGDMVLSSALSGDVGFTVQTAPAALVLPGASTTLQIAFDPNVQAVYNTTATLTSDDPGNASFSFKVSGNGANNLAGRYPGAAATNSLRVKKNTSISGYLDLSWGDSCGYAMSYTTGYAVYEGQLGNFTSHAVLPGYCDHYLPSASFVMPGAGSRYYLVSAVDSYTFNEGSLGQNSAGAEIVHPAGACEPNVNLTSCP